VGTEGTFFLVRLLPATWWGGGYLLPPAKLRVLPPRNGLIRRVCLVVLLDGVPCGDGFLRPSKLQVLPPRYGLIRRVWLVAFLGVLPPVSLCGDGSLRPSGLPVLLPRNGPPRRVLLVALVRRTALWRRMARILVHGMGSRVAVDVRRGPSGVLGGSRAPLWWLVR
jgi:hypothetical protein